MHLARLSKTLDMFVASSCRYFTKDHLICKSHQILKKKTNFSNRKCHLIISDCNDCDQSVNFHIFHFQHLEWLPCWCCWLVICSIETDWWRWSKSVMDLQPAINKLITRQMNGLTKCSRNSTTWGQLCQFSSVMDYLTPVAPTNYRYAVWTKNV